MRKGHSSGGRDRAALCASPTAHETPRWRGAPTMVASALRASLLALLSVRHGSSVGPVASPDLSAATGRQPVARPWVVTPACRRRLPNEPGDLCAVAAAESVCMHAHIVVCVCMHRYLLVCVWLPRRSANPHSRGARFCAETRRWCGLQVMARSGGTSFPNGGYGGARRIWSMLSGRL